MKKTFKIYTLGCKVNQYDSNSLSRKLLQAGLDAVKDKADLAIINTCAVTHSAITKDKKMVEQARKENPGAKIAVVGCMPVNYKEEVEALGVDYIYGTKEADKLIAQIAGEFDFDTFKSRSVSYPGCEFDEKLFKTGKSRYFMKIQDGCQQFCSYCIIPYNRGELSSRPMEEVVAEAKAVVGADFKEIILCGIHLGLYGINMPLRSEDEKNQIPPTFFIKGGERNNLVGLLRELIVINGLEKIRLSSIEVIDVSDELIELIKKERKMCWHLHIPLQAGCDKILKLMNRPYNTEFFKDKIEKIRKAIPEIAITTDVIVGFPNETAADFKTTFEFIKKINFSRLHVFPFSAHEKTPAYKMKNQLPHQLKVERAKELSKYSRRLETDFKNKFIGQELEVVVDGRSKDNKYRGKTEYYFDIEFESEKKLKAGELVEVKKWKLI